MTNHWNDIANSDVILVIGANPAENHPAAFGHITEAKLRGGKLISVDPRFTRTSSKADIYAPIRSGTDIAFIGGMIKYGVLADEKGSHVSQYENTFVMTEEGPTVTTLPPFEFKWPPEEEPESKEETTPDSDESSD